MGSNMVPAHNGFIISVDSLTETKMFLMDRGTDFIYLKEDESSMHAKAQCHMYLSIHRF